MKTVVTREVKWRQLGNINDKFRLCTWRMLFHEATQAATGNDVYLGAEEAGRGLYY